MAIIIHLGRVAETEAHRVYWLALGRFVHRFALLEQQIHYLLYLAAGINRAAAQALLSGVRADAALSLLRRVYEGRNQTELPIVTRAIAQFGIINSARNDIVHMGATQEGEAFLVSNANRTLPSKARTTRFTPDMIDHMTADLETISAALYIAQIEANKQGGTYPDDWTALAQAPWRYILLAQGKSPQISRGRAQARKDQQPPSKG